MPTTQSSTVQTVQRSRRFKLGCFLFACFSLVPGCAQDKELSPVGANATLSEDQKRIDQEIETQIRDELGEGDIDAEGLCPAGFVLSGSRCVKQQIYRLLRAYGRSEVDSAAPPALTAGENVAVLKLALKSLQKGDAVYLVADLAVENSHTSEVLVSAEIYQVESKKVVASLKGILLKEMLSFPIDLSGIFQPNDNSATNFELRVRVDPKPGVATGGTFPVVGGHLTALHYNQMAVDAVFDQGSAKEGYFQLTAENLSELDPGVSSNSHRLAGAQQKVYEKALTGLKAGDLVFVGASLSFSMANARAACTGGNRIAFSFSDGGVADPSKSVNAVIDSLSDTDFNNRAVDHQVVHNFAVFPITADGDRSFGLMFQQTVPGCLLSLPERENSGAFSYEVYRPMKHLKGSMSEARFLADAPALSESGPIVVPTVAEGKPGLTSIVNIGAIAEAQDLIFLEGTVSIAASDLLGLALGQTIGGLNIQSKDLVDKEAPDLILAATHNVQKSMFHSHFKTSMHVRSLIQVFTSQVELGKQKQANFQLNAYGRNIQSIHEDSEALPIQASDAQLQLRIFRKFGGLKPAM